VQIPFATSKSEKYAPLRRCLTFAAESVGFTDYHAAAIMNAFLERLTTEVSSGNIVMIPGFGIFGPGKDHWSRAKPENRHCIPKFCGSGGFRQQVRTDCKFEKNREDEIRLYKKNTGTWRKRWKSSRAFVTLHDARVQTIKWADAKGINVVRDDRPKVVLP